MRIGTRSIAQRKWTSKGHRPISYMKDGYTYSYLFQAVQPCSGKTFEMYLPNMDGACFRAFMQAFAQEHPGQTMIMDNAGCHHVGWEEENPPDVRIAYLSAYSPDYNPQERIFKELRKPLKGKIFDTIEQIEQLIDKQLQGFWQNPQNVKNITAWDWII